MNVMLVLRKLWITARLWLLPVLLIAVVAMVAAAPQPKPPSDPLVPDVVPVGNWNRIQTAPGGGQATSGVSRVKSDDARLLVQMRREPKVDSGSIDSLDDGSPVIMKCWIDWNPPGAGSAKWFLVIEANGAPHWGVSGFVNADLVWEQIRVPQCAPGVDPALLCDRPVPGIPCTSPAAVNPNRLRDSRIVLSGGNLTADGFRYFDIRLEKFPAGWRADLTCLRTTTTPWLEIGNVRLVANSSGVARSNNACRDGSGSFAVRMTEPVLGYGPWYSNGADWSAPGPAVPKPTISNFAATVQGPGQVGVSFNIGWQAGRDPMTCHFFVDGHEAFTAQCGTSSSKQFTGLAAGNHTFYATVTDRYGVSSGPSPKLTRTVPGQAPLPPPKPTISNFIVVVYTSEPGHVGVAYDVGWQAGRDPVTCHFFIDGQEAFTAQCGTHSSKQFYGITPGQHSFYATVSDAFGVYSDPSPTLVKTVPAPIPGPAATLGKGPAAPAGYRYAITLDHFAPNAGITITCHDSVDPQGFYTFTLYTDGNGHAFTQSYCYSGDHPDHWFRANGVESNHVTW